MIDRADQIEIAAGIVAALKQCATQVAGGLFAGDDPRPAAVAERTVNARLDDGTVVLVKLTVAAQGVIVAPPPPVDPESGPVVPAVGVEPDQRHQEAGDADEADGDQDGDQPVDQDGDHAVGHRSSRGSAP